MDKIELEKRVRWYDKKYGPYIEKRGFHNWKNLFRKPSLYEWAILFMLLMVPLMAMTYNQDIAECRNFIENIDYFCSLQRDNVISNATDQLIIKEEFNFSFDNG